MVSNKAKRAVKEEVKVEETNNTATENLEEETVNTKKEKESKKKLTKEEKKAEKAAKKAEAEKKKSERKEDSKIKNKVYKDKRFRLPEEEILRGKLSAQKKENKIDYLDETLMDVDEFHQQLIEGKVSFDEYFDKKADKAIYSLANAFATEKVGTPAFEQSITYLLGFMNPRHRQIAGYPKAKEKILAKAVEKSFRTGKPMLTKENVLKEAAFIAVLSYVTGIFLDEKAIFDMIPKNTENEEVIKAWNEYICKLPVGPGVKAAFTFVEGKCAFLEANKEKYCEVFSDYPQDDVPTDEDDNVPGHSVDLNKDLDRAFHATVENDDRHDEMVTSNLQKAAKKKSEQKEFTFGQLKSDANKTTVNPAKIAAELAAKTDEPIDSDNNPCTLNNRDFESRVPKLDKFTKCVNECGFNVAYSPEQMFPGLINATILDKNGKAVKTFWVDPYLMYGDTLRIITTDNAEGDIRKESFIPISQKNILVKAIKGDLKKEDRKKLSENLPRAITDFHEQYSFLDRVDMRGILSPDGKMGLPFEDWKKLVCNVAKVLEDKNLPVCRWRLMDILSPDRFTMLCDEHTKCVFYSPILQEQSNTKAIADGMVVIFDAVKYKAQGGYTIDHLNKSLDEKSN